MIYLITSSSNVSLDWFLNTAFPAYSWHWNCYQYDSSHPHGQQALLINHLPDHAGPSHPVSSWQADLEHVPSTFSFKSFLGLKWKMVYECHYQAQSQLQLSWVKIFPSSVPAPAQLGWVSLIITLLPACQPATQSPGIVHLAANFYQSVSKLEFLFLLGLPNWTG